MVHEEMEHLEEAWQYLKQAEHIWAILAESFADTPEYSRNLGIVRQWLARLSGNES